jgi:hypothetical protein
MKKKAIKQPERYNHVVVANLNSITFEISDSAFTEYERTGIIPFHLMYKVRNKLKEMQDNGESFIESLEEL